MTRVLAIGGPAHLQRFDVEEPLPSHTHFPVEDGEHNQYELYWAQSGVGVTEGKPVYVATGMDLEEALEHIDSEFDIDGELKEG